MGSPGTISVKFFTWTSADGQRTKWPRNIAENFNCLSRAHERYRRQTTDGRTTTYSERQREFTFAKKHVVVVVDLNVLIDFFCYVLLLRRHQRI